METLVLELKFLRCYCAAKVDDESPHRRLEWVVAIPGESRLALVVPADSHPTRQG
jgi:hypothetical protein